MSWNIKASQAALRTINPIRDIVDRIDFNDVNKDLPLISLSIGDPTVFGNLPTHDEVTAAVVSSVSSQKWNGYKDATGAASARAAVAKDAEGLGMRVSESDVILASGASHALMMCVIALCNPGDNILLPRPGFSLYVTLCGYHGVEVRTYDLIPERQWEADVASMDSLVDDRTKAVLINNPSNPTGSVYSREHLSEIVAFAHKHQLPIIADEIYAKLVFQPGSFHAVASVAASAPTEIKVPVLHVCGLAKNYLVPGWRLGWLIVNDPSGLLGEVREGLRKLATLIVGPNAPVQGALPDILESVPAAWNGEVAATLARNGRVCMEEMESIPQLDGIAPSGAMYLMVRVRLELLDGIESDVDFAKALLREQSVVVLPGQVFGTTPDFFRVVCCGSEESLRLAFGRIRAFCAAHSK